MSRSVLETWRGFGHPLHPAPSRPYYHRSPPTRQTQTLQIPLGPAHHHRPCPTDPAPSNGPSPDRDPAPIRPRLLLRLPPAGAWALHPAVAENRGGCGAGSAGGRSRAARPGCGRCPREPLSPPLPAPRPCPSEAAARLGPGRAFRRVRGAGSQSTCPALRSRLGQRRPLRVWTPAPPSGKSVGLGRLGVDVGRGLRRSGGPRGGGGVSGREAPRRDLKCAGSGAAVAGTRRRSTVCVMTLGG